MRDKPLIFGGLGLFLALVTMPFWYNLALGKCSKGPDIKLPVQAKQCVAPVAFMRTDHMKLLSAWRDDVVRRGIRAYPAADGKTYEISLTRTCLGECHTSKQEFCDRCHTYAGVQGPYCWDCHADPQQGKPLPGGRGSEHARNALPSRDREGAVQTILRSAR